MAKQNGSINATKVTDWFAALPHEKQREVLGHLQSSHEVARAAKRAQLEKQLAELGFDVPSVKKRGRPKAVKPNGNGAARSKAKGSVKAKYRDPKTGETWSGRGRMANWLKAKQDAGQSVEKFLI